MLYIDSGANGCILKVKDNILISIYDMPYIKSKQYRGYDYDTIKELILSEEDGVVMEEVFTFTANWSSSNHLLLFKGYMRGLCHGLNKTLYLIPTRTLFGYIRERALSIMNYDDKETMREYLNEHPNVKETKYLSMYLCQHLLLMESIKYHKELLQYREDTWYYLNEKGNMRKLHDGVSDAILLWQYHHHSYNTIIR